MKLMGKKQREGKSVVVFDSQGATIVDIVRYLVQNGWQFNKLTVAVPKNGQVVTKDVPANKVAPLQAKYNFDRWSFIASKAEQAIAGQIDNGKETVIITQSKNNAINFFATIPAGSATGASATQQGKTPEQQRAEKLAKAKAAAQAKQQEEREQQLARARAAKKAAAQAAAVAAAEATAAASFDNAVAMGADAGMAGAAGRSSSMPVESFAVARQRLTPQQEALMRRKRELMEKQQTEQVPISAEERDAAARDAASALYNPQVQGDSTDLTEAQRQEKRNASRAADAKKAKLASKDKHTVLLILSIVEMLMIAPFLFGVFSCADILRGRRLAPEDPSEAEKRFKEAKKLVIFGIFFAVGMIAIGFYFLPRIIG